MVKARSLCTQLHTIWLYTLYLALPLPQLHANRPVNLFVAASTITLLSFTIFGYHHYKKKICWPWNTIEQCDTDFPAQGRNFPKNFLWGVGTSAYQVEGNCPHSTYGQWQKTNPHYPDSVDIACDHAQRYKEDIQRMKKELGVGAYRFSLEWSNIEPTPGNFDIKQLEHYADVCKELLKNNIKPVIGLHHYSDPQWFMDKGGFVKEANIHFFVRFCKTVFNYLMNNVPDLFVAQPIFLTFNSPASYASSGYLMGKRPPGKHDIRLMLTVLKNMLEAHVTAYKTIKKEPFGFATSIGITHNIFQIDPYWWCNPIAHVRSSWTNKLVHDSVYRFFTTGIFDIHLPCITHIKHYNNKASQSLDLVGLNYYSHGYLGTWGQPCRSHTEIPTDNPQYSVYPEGLYRAIKEVSQRLACKLDIPVYITENGIATTNDALRDLFLKRYIYALSCAIQDGYPVAGYVHWSFMDNYEWGSYTPRYGLYHVDRTALDPDTGRPTLERTLRQGAQYFVDIVRDTPKEYNDDTNETLDSNSPDKHKPFPLRNHLPTAK